MLLLAAETSGNQDAHGRALPELGSVDHRAGRHDLRAAAAQPREQLLQRDHFLIIEEDLPAAPEPPSPVHLDPLPAVVILVEANAMTGLGPGLGKFKTAHRDAPLARPSPGGRHEIADCGGFARHAAHQKRIHFKN